MHSLYAYNMFVHGSNAEWGAAAILLTPAFHLHVASRRDTSRSTVLDGRISKEVFAVYAVVEQRHICRYSPCLILVKHGAEIIRQPSPQTTSHIPKPRATTPPAGSP